MSQLGQPSASRRIMKTAGLLLKRFFLASILVFLTYHFIGYPAMRRVLPEKIPAPWLTARPVESVLIFAPHSDDETLGCAGAIMHALAQGARVHVVLVTCGDGFPIAAEAKAKGRRPRSEHYLSLGYARQGETLAALKVLGLGPENVTFLGYPDGGIAKLWGEFWTYDNLLSSRYTKTQRSPYFNSFTPGAPYCGLSAVNNIATIIKKTKPSHILVPHPNDTHSDHWGTFALVTYALHRLTGEGQLTTTPTTVAYLVHRGDWPLPRLYRPKWPLDPPPKMLQLPERWLYHPMSDQDIAQKRLAILSYKSQILFMRMYMLSFVRNNELFFPLRSQLVAKLGDEDESVIKRDHLWKTAGDVIVDPTDDTISRRLGPGADLKEAAALLGRDTLYILVKPKGRISPRIRYNIDICNFASHRTMVSLSMGPKNIVRKSAKATPAQIRHTTDGLEFAIPLSIFSSSDRALPGSVFFSVQSRLGNTVVDRTAWTVLRLSADEPEIFRESL